MTTTSTTRNVLSMLRQMRSIVENTNVINSTAETDTALVNVLNALDSAVNTFEEAIVEAETHDTPIR
jgi:hypothetical protein